MTATGKLVMIIDDDGDLRETLGELLGLEGYRTVLCDNGATALDRLSDSAEKPALILLDLMMPLMNGWEFRKRQLEKPSLAAIPVVVMTASRSVEGIEVDEVLFKPPDVTRLFAVIREQLASDHQE